MSLALALNQIQKPTWWYEGNKAPTVARPSKPEVIAKRAEMLAWIKAQKRKVCGIELRDHFGLTTSQLWSYMDPMVDDGLIRKHKPRHDRTLLEAV